MINPHLHDTGTHSPPSTSKPTRRKLSTRTEPVGPARSLQTNPGYSSWGQKLKLEYIQLASGFPRSGDDLSSLGPPQPTIAPPRRGAPLGRKVFNAGCWKSGHRRPPSGATTAVRRRLGSRVQGSAGLGKLCRNQSS